MNKSNFILLGATFAFALVFATSCTKEYIGEQKVVSDCDTATVKYSVQIKTIMSGSCAITGCHDNTTMESGLDLNTYASVQSINNNGLLKNRINDAVSPMPRSGKILPCKIKTIEKWIRAGAPNN